MQNPRTTTGLQQTTRRRFLIGASAAGATTFLGMRVAVASGLETRQSKVVQLSGEILGIAALDGDLLTLRGEPGSYVVQNETSQRSSRVQLSGDLHLRGIAAAGTMLQLVGHERVADGAQSFKAGESLEELIAKMKVSPEVAKHMLNAPEIPEPQDFDMEYGRLMPFIAEGESVSSLKQRRLAMPEWFSGSVGASDPGSGRMLIEEYEDSDVPDSIVRIHLTDGKRFEPDEKLNSFPASHNAVFISASDGEDFVVGVQGITGTEIVDASTGDWMFTIPPGEIPIALRLTDGTVEVSTTSEAGPRTWSSNVAARAVPTPRPASGPAIQTITSDIEIAVEAHLEND